MTILVTGATGLVGARLLPRLVEAGMDCRALIRSGKEVPAGVMAAKGDLLDPASLTQVVKGVSAIIHLAAVFRTPDTDLIWKSNLEGTRNLIAAAKAHASETRFIMASTANVYNIDSPRPGREDDAADPKMAYPASKLAAENELRESGLNGSIQRFGFVYGDKDGLERMRRAIRGVGAVRHRNVSRARVVCGEPIVAGRVDNSAVAIH
jgi:UDP-glucose 4-epimerase